MAAAGLDALLIFRQESMYWLTGYDTFGYVLLPGAGARRRRPARRCSPARPTGCRRASPRASRTSASGATPATPRPEREPAGDCSPTSASPASGIGVEWDAYGLTAANGRRLAAALDGFATLADASLLVTALRAVKSPAEIACLREAAALADAALDAAVAATGPGAFEGDILAEMQGAIYRGGGDDPANEHIIGSGPGALLCRY